MDKTFLNKLNHISQTRIMQRNVHAANKIKIFIAVFFYAIFIDDVTICPFSSHRYLYAHIYNF